MASFKVYDDREKANADLLREAVSDADRGTIEAGIALANELCDEARLSDYVVLNTTVKEKYQKEFCCDALPWHSGFVFILANEVFLIDSRQAKLKLSYSLDIALVGLKELLGASHYERLLADITKMTEDSNPFVMYVFDTAESVYWTAYRPSTST
eukprot:TRINITY_DN11754_c0_g1_i1.p1 TRINITY_DN11754_c0_g1~~TRINITY_DN11754_c0_g1_i1.p1  ORF type:complete len:174 (-),score=3.32 TRINITY_DN11754_c0_g1_i1:82-546(-)